MCVCERACVGVFAFPSVHTLARDFTKQIFPLFSL